MNPQNKITEAEIIESLSRSGYLLESQITKHLIELGYFVESNLTSLDPLTGKSREIDLYAEHSYNASENSKYSTIALVRFIFEIKNNDFPLVLLTKFENSPDSNIYTGYKNATSFPVKIKGQYFEDFIHYLFYMDERNLYTQYCSFSRKKNEELMAHHPENLYSSLLKLTQYCEEAIEPWQSGGPAYEGDTYFRNFLCLPVLLINEDLYELDIANDNTNELKKVESSRLVFNYHYKQRPHTSIVHVVTKKGLDSFLQELYRIEKIVEKNMIELYHGDA